MYAHVSELQKLTFDDKMNMQGAIKPFVEIFDACRDSLQKIVVPADYYFAKNPQIFHLRCLYFKSDKDDIYPYLCHPSCVAPELIIEIIHQKSTVKYRWRELIDSFNDAEK